MQSGWQLSVSRNLSVFSGEHIWNNMRNCLKCIINFLRYKSTVIRWDAEGVLLVLGWQAQYELLHLVVAKVWRSAL
jgi:hypothetical protein